MISQLYSKLIKKENLFDLSIFIKEYSSFEEVPLVTRYSHIDFLNKFIDQEDIQSFLINLGFFLLNNINFYAKKNLSPDEFKEFFVCMTFCNFEDYEETGYIIPNIFVTRKKGSFSYLKEAKRQYTGDTNLKQALINCNLLGSFYYLTTETLDEDSDILRIYAIPQV